MSEPNRNVRLRDIAPNYDAMLCDAWGVVHNGVEALPGAAEAMIRFRKERGPLVILTNAPRPSSVIPGQLDRLGVPREAYDAVVSSGDATRAEIERRLPAPAFKIGPDKDDPLFERLGIDFRPLEDADFIICTGLIDDRRETPEDYRDLLGRAAERNLEMICANPDIVVNWGGRMLWCAGALAEIYEGQGGKVVYGGKPHGAIYSLALEAVEQAGGAAVERARILVVGDGLKTDILGANRNGMDAVLVTGGAGVFEDGADLSSRLEAAGVRVIGAMEALQW